MNHFNSPQLAFSKFVFKNLDTSNSTSQSTEVKSPIELKEAQKAGKEFDSQLTSEMKSLEMELDRLTDKEPSDEELLRTPYDFKKIGEAIGMQPGFSFRGVIDIHKQLKSKGIQLFKEDFKGSIFFDQRLFVESVVRNRHLFKNGKLIPGFEKKWEKDSGWW